MSVIGTHTSYSEADTCLLAARLAHELTPGMVVAMVGDLGAGKTCFVRGLARTLGVPEEVPVTSPTFAIMNVYDQGRMPVYHFDLYRLADEDELEAVGFRDYVGGTGVAVIEWADRIPGVMPVKSVWVRISDGEKANERTIVVESL